MLYVNFESKARVLERKIKKHTDAGNDLLASWFKDELGRIKEQRSRAEYEYESYMASKKTVTHKSDADEFRSQWYSYEEYNISNFEI